ncbi:MAG: lipid-A-disaccharide synthase, partial [Woeseiaceae bacterium]
AYRLAPLTYWMGKHLFRVKLTHFTLPNLLTDEPLIPEFMQQDAQPEPLAEAVLALLADPDRRRSISARFDRLREELALDADQRAAAAVMRLARH